MLSALELTQPREGAIEIEWFGHSMFTIRGSDGFTVLTDPFDSRVGYPVPEDINAQAVLITHDHADHSNTEAAPHDAVIIRSKTGTFSINEIGFAGLSTWHDMSEGSQRGSNTVYRWTMDDIAIVHTGDIGEPISNHDAELLRPVDLLMIPVGGHFTVEPEIAKDIADLLKPVIIIPMHYKTEKCTFPIKAVSEFTHLFESVLKVDSKKIFLKKPFPKNGPFLVVMDYE